MPQTVYTAYDTGGQTKMTDMDQIAEQRRREMADQAFRGALLNNQNNMTREGWGRADALNANNMNAQERIAQMNNQTQLQTQGAYSDRATNSLAQIREQMTPARMEQERQNALTAEGADLRRAKSAGEIGRLNFENNIFGQLTGGMGQGQPSAGMNAMDPKQLRMAMAWLNKDPSLLKDQFDVDFRDVVKSQVASGALDPVEALTALRSGDPSAIRRREVTALAPEQLGEDLRSKSKGFLTRDTSSVGLDPGESQDEEIVALRDKYFRALKIEQPRLSDEQALEAANYLAERELTAEGVGWGSRDASDRLLRRLRGQAPRTGAMAGTSPTDPYLPISPGGAVGAGMQWLTR